MAFYLCLASCRAVNRPERILFHYHHEPHGPWWDAARPWLELHRVEPEALVAGFDYPDALVRRFSYAHHADFIRLRALIEHGGVYSDMDTLFVNPLPEDLYHKPFVMGRELPVVRAPGEAPEDSLCNAMMMAEPGADFARAWLADMYRSFDGSWSRHSCTQAAIVRERMPETVHVEPPRTFYKHESTAAGIERLFLGLDTDNEGVCSFHLWNHLWWEASRRDFSLFHAGLLTPEFVRYVDTTYNVIARRFLPPPA
jgi:hypothetical protein